MCGGLSFHCLFPSPSGTRLPLVSPSHLRTGRLAHLVLCQWGPSYRCSRSDIASQDFSIQDVYLERNSPWVLLTHTLTALPDSQGSGSTRWPPAICGLSVETAAVAAGNRTALQGSQLSSNRTVTPQVCVAHLLCARNSPWHRWPCPPGSQSRPQGNPRSPARGKQTAACSRAARSSQSCSALVVLPQHPPLWMEEELGSLLQRTVGVEVWG